MTERERAEALINQLDTLARAYDAYVLGLSPLPEERAKYFDAILAYAREERARTYEEAAYYLEYRSSGPIPPDAIDHMKDCAKHMREEGGQR